MAEELFASDDKGLWEQIFDQYAFVLKKKSDNQKKTNLADLDKWYQYDLPMEIASRSPKYLSKEELVKVMKWKLMRGKFRPRLTELVQQNSEKDVQAVSAKAFKNYKNIREAIKELSKLKAVGPATASAIMTASNPEVHAFMADEVMESIPGFKVAYTLPAYVQFQEALAKKAQKLKQGSDVDWTPHKIELALWTNKLAKRLGTTLTTKISSGSSNNRKKKRDMIDDEKVETDDETGKTKLKRSKAK